MAGGDQRVETSQGGPRFAWISTRRVEAVAAEFNNAFSEKQLLADVLKSTAAPLQEFDKAKAVMVEAPAITKQSYEHELLDSVGKLRSRHREAILLVQPSLRGKVK